MLFVAHGWKSRLARSLGGWRGVGCGGVGEVTPRLVDLNEKQLPFCAQVDGLEVDVALSSVVSRPVKVNSTPQGESRGHMMVLSCTRAAANLH